MFDSPQQSIAGQWLDGLGRNSVSTINPATGKEIARYPSAGPEDIERALVTANSGFSRWRSTPAGQRTKVLRRAAELLCDRAEAIAISLTKEQGKPLSEAKHEVQLSAAMLEWQAEEAGRCYGLTIPAQTQGVRLHTLQHAIGPVAAFTPWNFPLMLSAMKIGAALAAGCSVILKPSEETPSAPMALVQCLHEAGLPPDALQLLIGDPAEISHALISSPIIRKVSFTGSPGVGRLVGALAGRHLKPITLELGGHAPFIVCADADLAKASAALLQIKFRNSGQICANPSRIFVHESKVTEFRDALCESVRSIHVGDGMQPDATMGPMANARRVAAMKALTQDAVSRGASIFQGKTPETGDGFFFPPTVMWDVSSGSKVMSEEIFGPIVPLVSFQDFNEAVAKANSVPLGLAAFVFTESLATARFVSEEINCGSIGINTVGLMRPEAPFGGILDSGYGRENGSAAIQAYLSTRTVVTGV